MNIEQKEKNYAIARKLEGTRCLLEIIRNDINNSNGAVSEDVISNALGCVCDYMNHIQSDMKM